jgi:hypothetical protein
MTQVEMLARHLEEAGSITNVEAQAMYKIRALPRRIKDLEDYRGFKVKRVWKTDLTGQRYVRYVSDN